MDPDAKKLFQAASKFSYIGIFFGVAIVIGYFGGRWLDQRLHTTPWLSIVGLLVGAASGFRELIRLSRQAMRTEQDGQDGQDGHET